MSREEKEIHMKIRLLRKAKAYLRRVAPSATTGICMALNEAWRDVRGEEGSAIYELSLNCWDYLIEYISDSLGDHGFLLGWLREQGVAVSVFEVMDAVKLRDTRCAWIDWMIACYEEDLAALK